MDIKQVDQHLCNWRAAVIFFAFKNPNLHATCRTAFIAAVKQLAFQEITNFFEFVSNGHLRNCSSWHFIVLEPGLMLVKYMTLLKD